MMHACKEVFPSKHFVEIRWYDDDTNTNYRRFRTKQVNSGERVEFEFDIVASFFAIGMEGDDIVSYVVNGILVHTGSNTYIYAEEGVALGAEQASEISDEFDNVIYPKEETLFGNPDGNLGDIDGDPHVYILFHDAHACMRARIYVRRFSMLIDSYRRLPPLLGEEWKQRAECIVEACMFRIWKY